MSQSDAVAYRCAKILGPLWPKAVQHMKATLSAVLDTNAQCELVIVDDAGAICYLSDAPNRIVVSTGQIVRTAAISNVIAKKMSESGASNIHVVDPHWFDDMKPDSFRKKIVKRRPPPGMAPAFGDVSEPEHLWNWAEQQLSPAPMGRTTELYEAICLFALAFLIAHEAAHLIFDHIDVHRRILEGGPDCWEHDQKCVEIHADLEVIKAFVSGVLRAGVNAESDLALAFERLALTGVGILVSLSFGHHTMRGLRTYDDPVSDVAFLGRKYPHPSVRLVLMQGFLIRYLNEMAPQLGDLAAPSFLSAAADALFALNGWYLSEAKKAGKGNWAIPHPFSLVMSQAANYPMKTAEEFRRQHLPSYFARHFPNADIADLLA